jgi:hypothetical protein
LLALLYGVYAFGFALLNPAKAPPVELGGGMQGETVTRNEALAWYLLVPGAILIAASLAGSAGLVGSQSLAVSGVTRPPQRPNCAPTSRRGARNR